VESHLEGPVVAGTKQRGHPDGQNLGGVVLSQSVTLQAASQANVDGYVDLPAGAEIQDFQADSTVAWTATTAGLTIGNVAGGNQYVSSFDVKTITRGPTAAYTTAQLLAMSNIGSNTRVYFRVTSTGPNNTGTTKVTVRYKQN